MCAPRSGLSTLARCGGVTIALGMLGALPKCSVRRFQNGLHLLPQSGVGNIPTFPQKESHTTAHKLKERAFLLRPQLPLIYHQIFTNMSTASIILPVDFVATAFAVWYDEVRQTG